MTATTRSRRPGLALTVVSGVLLVAAALLAGSALAQESGAADLFGQARAAAREGRFEQALELARRGVEAAPDAADGLNLVGALSEQVGDLDGARDAYTAAMAADPEWAVPPRNLGRLYLRRGQYLAAVLPLERAAELTPEDPIPFALLGAAHNAAGRVHAARTAFDRALELDRDSVAIAVDAAWARLADGDAAAAVAAAEHAVEVDGENVIGLTALGDILLQSPATADVVRASTSYRQAIAAHPGDPRLWLGLARIYEQLGMSAEQVEALRGAIAAGADDAETWHALGDALDGITAGGGGVASTTTLDGEARYSEAVEAFTRALELDPERGVTYYLRGQAYFNMDRREEAAADVSRAIDALPGDPGPLLTMARFLLRRGELAAAEPYIERARAIEPGSSAVDFLLGRLRLLQDRVDEAVPLLERAAADPRQIDARYLLGQALVKRGDVERGRQVMAAYQQSLNEQRGDQVQSLRLGVMGRGRAYAMRGRVFLEEGRFEQAREQLEASVEISPDDAEAWEALARAYDALGLEAEAARARARGRDLAGRA